MRIQAVNNNYFLQRTNGNYCCFTGKDLLNMSKEEVFNEVKESINDDQFVGSGWDAKVYKIADSPYCVRIPDICEDGYINDFNKDLKPCDIVNHIKIKLGAGAAIMDYFKGKTLFPLQLYDEPRHKLQKEISQMPVESYSNLLHQIAYAIDNEMAYDKGAGNIIIDTENQKLTVIDFYQIKDNPNPTTPLKDIFYTLTSYGAENDTAKKIAHKIIFAALEEFKPDTTPCMDTELFDFKGIIDAAYYLSNSKSDEEINNIIKNFEKLKEIKKKEIRDKKYSDALEQQIEITTRAISKYLQ